MKGVCPANGVAAAGKPNCHRSQMTASTSAARECRRYNESMNAFRRDSTTRCPILFARHLANTGSHLARPLCTAGRARSRLPSPPPATREPPLGSQLTKEEDFNCPRLGWAPRTLPPLPLLAFGSGGILPRGVDRAGGSTLPSTPPAATARADARASATEPEHSHTTWLIANETRSRGDLLRSNHSCQWATHLAAHVR